MGPDNPNSNLNQIKLIWRISSDKVVMMLNNLNILNRTYKLYKGVPDLLLNPDKSLILYHGVIPFPIIHKMKKTKSNKMSWLKKVRMKVMTKRVRVTMYMEIIDNNNNNLHTAALMNNLMEKKRNL